MNVYSVCALCLQEAPLRQSHIIPRFVLNHMASEAANDRHVMSPTSPNQPQQGGIKGIHIAALLCEACEARFSRWEGAFQRYLFTPFHRGEQGPFAYREWLLKYAVSQSWRSAVMRSTQLALPTAIRDPARRAELVGLRLALAAWRGFLLDERPDPGPYQHHLVLYDYPLDRMPLTLNHRYEYWRAGVDYAIIWRNGSMAIFTKLCRMVLWSTLHPLDAVGWRNTRIQARGEIGPSREQRISRADGAYLWTRIERELAAMRPRIKPHRWFELERQLHVNMQDLGIE